MGGCKSKVDKNVERTPVSLELKVEKRPLVELQDKITYEGEWLGDKKHGYGVQKWPDGAVFEGNFVNGTANGFGIFIHTDGDKYEGEWQNDRAHGHGTYTHSDGSKYVGEWKNDKKHGKAIESWVDGSSFEGSYAYGLKQGFGKFSWHDGSKYIGNFDANQINGYGIYYWNDGRVYTGCWLKNHMFGYGKFDWTDHRCYEGQYINDKKDGDGKFTWPDGRAYIGQWKNGKQHGIGIFYNIKKEGKVGEWRDGSRLRWIKSSLENGELVGEGLKLREEYLCQREELLKANDLYENYKKLPKNDKELQQLRALNRFDENLVSADDTKGDEILNSNQQDHSENSDSSVNFQPQISSYKSRSDAGAEQDRASGCEDNTASKEPERLEIEEKARQDNGDSELEIVDLNQGVDDECKYETNIDGQNSEITKVTEDANNADIIVDKAEPGFQEPGGNEHKSENSQGDFLGNDSSVAEPEPKDTEGINNDEGIDDSEIKSGLDAECAQNSEPDQKEGNLTDGPDLEPSLISDTENIDIVDNQASKVTDPAQD
ncbi:membrane occupation and recognition nexus protein morn2 [Cryptosporidium felis]|nr:membrane occupation and recognition nexus protein morn2 [Cryptosporidium felis]